MFINYFHTSEVCTVLYGTVGMLMCAISNNSKNNLLKV